MSFKEGQFIRPLLRVSGYALIAVLFLQACAKKDEQAALPHFSPREPYPSPFEYKKVILTPETFQSTAPTIEESQATPEEPEEAKTPKDITLVAVVDNNCTEKRCKTITEEDYSLSCYFFEHPARKPELPTQFFDFQLPRPMRAEEIAYWVSDDNCILGITNQFKYEAQSFNDTYYTPEQTDYLNTIKLEQAQPHFTADKLDPVKVAVIDTGVGVHPDIGGDQDLPGVIWREDMRSGGSINAPECSGLTYTNEAPYNTHGTFVGGIIAAKPNNNLGIAGLAPNAQLISLTVGNCEGRILNSEIGNAMLYALAREAEVVNLSFGGSTWDDPAIRHSIITLLNAKILIVASAGNNYKDLRLETNYPASYAIQYPGLVTVAWGTQDGDLYHGNQANRGSNYSPDHIKILAPGSSIASTMSPSNARGYSPLSDGYGVGSGSSFSAPIVSAAAALVIGFLKHHNLEYDERMVEYILIDRGVTHQDSLLDYVRDGSVLDMEKLGSTLQYILDTGDTPQPITLSDPQVYWSPSANAPQVEFTANWDLQASHFDARLGLFDTTCGYSKPCLIQDYELTDNVGSKSFQLSRNELLPMLASISDPNFDIHVAIAIYYRIWNPFQKQYLNNYGIDALTKLNIRDLELAVVNPRFQGAVTNIRMDMQHVYVQGWACLEGSNKAVPVELIDTNGAPIQSAYAYSYTLMVLHTPIDPNSHSQNGGPFVALGMKVNFTGKSSYKAGLEASPLMLADCKTFTAAHGYEFAIPLSQIANNNLSGTAFSVRASNPKQLTTQIILEGPFKNTHFIIPEVNYQPSLTSTVTLTRENDSILINGSICTASPNPIHLEITFSEWNTKCRLKQLNGFPDFSDSCPLGSSYTLPLLHDTQIPERNTFKAYDADTSQDPWTAREKTIDLQMSADEMSRHLALFPLRWPNTSVSFPSPLIFDPNFMNPYFDSILANNLVEVPTGDPITDIQRGKVTIADSGENIAPGLKEFLDDRAGTSHILYTKDSSAWYWDHYDIGEPYTPSVVGYSVDTTKTVGDYLFSQFRVRKFLREVKKYETPLGVESHILGHQVISNGSPESPACPHRFSFSKEISDISKVNPNISAYIHAFLKNNTPPLANLPIDSDIDTVMQQIPIDMRFFQDGVMIRHLLSDYASDTTVVETLGRGN